MNKSKVMLVAGVVCLGIATSASASIVANGDFETVVIRNGMGNGGLAYTLDTLTGAVIADGGTQAGVNEWVWSNDDAVPAYDETGGNGSFISNFAEKINTRAILQFAQDDKATTGFVNINFDVMFNEGAGSDLRLYAELYAWNDGDSSPELTFGGASTQPAIPAYNETVLNGAATIFTKQIHASDVADSAWTTISLAAGVDLGTTGYDYYTWRIGSVDKLAGDTFAFDNLTVVAVPEPATLGMVAIFGGGILFIRRKLMM